MRARAHSFWLAVVLSGLGGLGSASAAQTPAPTPPPRIDLQWYRIALQHTAPDDVLKLMHWDKPMSPASGQSSRKLPEGVQGVFALQALNTLLVEATPDGYGRVRQITSILDVGKFTWMMRVRAWKATVPASGPGSLDLVPMKASGQMPEPVGGTLDHAVWEHIEIADGPTVSHLLAATLTAGRAVAVPVRYLEEQTQRWLVSGMVLDVVRLDSDGSVSVALTGEGFSPAQKSPRRRNVNPAQSPRLVFHSGDVVALRLPDKDAGQILFLRVDY